MKVKQENISLIIPNTNINMVIILIDIHCVEKMSNWNEFHNEQYHSKSNLILWHCVSK